MNEDDALIADKIFGWPTISKVTPFRTIVELFGGFILDGVAYKFTGVGYDNNYFRPTSEPAADVSVLQHVRENWSEEDRQAFVKALCKECRIRDTDYSTSGTLDIFVDHFKVGDYSRAALAVLKAKQPALLPPGKEGE